MADRATFLDRETLLTRVRILEAAMECIAREAEPAFEAPEVAFMALQRVSSVARQSLPREGGDICVI